MKSRKFILFSMMFGLLLSLNINAQEVPKAEPTGLPGDNFSLQGALDLFSKAATPEDFEKALNNKKNNVNNLDLNADGKIDYIKVIDKMDKDVHAIVLQAIISEKEVQDVAVIEIEKKGSDDAIGQIVGDVDIYGKDVYVEAKVDDQGGIKDPNSGVKRGPSAYEYDTPFRIYFNVWAWPCVRYMYRPVYVVYVSPWHWDRHPYWWNPWQPYEWDYFYPRSYHYHHHYVVIREPRCYRAREVYRPHRTTSHYVHNRNERAIRQYREVNKINVYNDNRDRKNDRSNVRDNNDSRKRNATVPNTSDRSRDRQSTQIDQRDKRSNTVPSTDNKRRTEKSPATVPQNNANPTSPERARDRQTPPQTEPGRSRTGTTPAPNRESTRRTQKSEAPAPSRKVNPAPEQGYRERQAPPQESGRRSEPAPSSQSRVREPQRSSGKSEQMQRSEPQRSAPSGSGRSSGQSRKSRGG